jgi:diacylglycerol O-acyltransferase / wax synthase
VGSVLAQALVERATIPAEAARGLRALTRAPRRVLRTAAERAVAVGAIAGTGLNPAPPTPLNVPIGPHRRYAWIDWPLAELKAVKDALGGTLNDAVLTAVALGLGTWLRGRDVDTNGLVLRALVPVSVRVEAERGALGNRVSVMWAPLPVGERDPREAFEQVHRSLAGLKESGQAIGAATLTRLADFAPPTMLSQAARLQPRQRMFNVVVTNVPGPQFPLYLQGRRLLRFLPVVPLAERQALGIAILSYDGALGIGLLADRDALPDLPAVREALVGALEELSSAAGAEPTPPANRGGRSRSATRA